MRFLEIISRGSHCPVRRNTAFENMRTHSPDDGVRIQAFLSANLLTVTTQQLDPSKL